MKLIGWKAALELLKEGHTMVHEGVCCTKINGITIMHPGFHYLIPYCDEGKKQKNGDVFYNIKEIK